MKSKILGLLAVSSLAIPAAANAAAGTASGSANGLSWQAQSVIVGQTGTGTAAAVPPGNPIYNGAFPAYSGVVGLLMDYGAGGAFVCSGTLLNDRASILTAGHCVSGGGGVADSDLVSVTAFFRGPGSNADTYVYPNGGVVDPTVTTRDVTNIFVNSGYTGEVIDQNDIAVLRLSDLAPDFATSYDIYTGGDLTGQDFNVAGYGNRSVTGGADGTTGPGAGAGTGRFRQGDNRYDFAWGDSDFEGFFTDEDANGENFFGTADIEYSYLSDFDNGRVANDASCALAVAGLGLAPSAKFCNTGRGATEASIAGGDSGGPGFIDGKLASVNSYSLIFSGQNLGADYKAGLQSSWGEFAGYVPTFIHTDFILSSMVPEPGTWVMMIGGFGLIGASMRSSRRRAILAA